MKMPIVDRQKKTITVTKEFIINAGQFGTPEFHILHEMKQRHSDYSVEIYRIARNPDKLAYSNLTYRNMQDFITGSEIGEAQIAALKEFTAIQNISKTMRGSYAFVKKWFLDKYGDEFKQFQKEQEAKKRAVTESHLLYSIND